MGPCISSYQLLGHSEGGGGGEGLEYNFHVVAHVLCVAEF